jgi:hypothetical protein
MFVFTSPGHSTLTPTLSSASSSASVSLIPTTAYFVPLYGPIPATATARHRRAC